MSSKEIRRTTVISRDEYTAIDTLVEMAKDREYWEDFHEQLLMNVDVTEYGITEEEAANWKDETEIPPEIYDEAPDHVYKAAVTLHRRLIGSLYQAFKVES